MENIREHVGYLKGRQRVRLLEPADLPEHIQQELSKRNGFITRNSTCPCGSRKRFKRCCGLRKGAR